MLTSSQFAIHSFADTKCFRNIDFRCHRATGTVWWSELSRVLPQRERLSIFNLLATYAGTPTPATPGPVAMRYEASTSVTFQAMDITTRRDGEGGADGEEGVEEEDMWHIGEIPWGPFSPHFFNYLLAHLVYAGRYAGVFWGTNKALGLVFFFQLILNAAQSIFSINGFQVTLCPHSTTAPCWSKPAPQSTLRTHPLPHIAPRSPPPHILYPQSPTPRPLRPPRIPLHTAFPYSEF
ncbi:hypothetical protein E2C01_036964 [Portunus trituberculatus]|uniref:Uncharacterized protein n=1 Tax=Portunus trituberculatus TaxID=210409 RepID=A0A5B7F6V3_PORTR|nr:hypothetical protein [Portunus trituberculatus]